MSYYSLQTFIKILKQNVLHCTDMISKSNQIKFIEQQKAKSHLEVAKTMIETINILFIIYALSENVKTVEASLKINCTKSKQVACTN